MTTLQRHRLRTTRPTHGAAAIWWVVPAVEFSLAMRTHPTRRVQAQSAGALGRRARALRGRFGPRLWWDLIFARG